MTIEGLSDALTRFSRVLHESERPRDARIRWVLAGLDYGSAGATARAEPLDDESAEWVPRIIDGFIDAARRVHRGEVGSQPLLRAVRDLTDVASGENRVVLETADDDVLFSGPVPVVAAATDQPDTTKSLGTVRGRVETLSQRKHLRFTLYDLATDKAVGCYLNPDDEDQMRHAWGRVADVTGQVTRDATTGRPLSIRRVTSVQIVEEGTPGGYRRAKGAIGGTEPAEKVIRRIRDAS